VVSFCVLGNDVYLPVFITLSVVILISLFTGTRVFGIFTKMCFVLPEHYCCYFNGSVLIVTTCVVANTSLNCYITVFSAVLLNFSGTVF